MADFQQLRNSIEKGDVLTPDSAGYEESLERWSRACVKHAKVVVRPTSALEVSTAVRFATQNALSLVVCCGGHSTGGDSSTDDGMVIDLTKMNDVLVHPVSKTATYGGGCRWKDIDAAAAKYGLATVGGTVNDTGVGGLTLGGGYGWLTPRYGLAIDNLLAVEIVLGDGNIVRASEEENEDLFWAIRGAGQHFGVVTRFTARLYPQRNVWAGVLVLPFAKLAETIEFAAHFHEVATDQALLFGILGSLPGVGIPAIITAVFFNGAKEEGEAFFKPLLDLDPISNTTKEIPYPEANQQMPGDEYGARRLRGGASFAMPLDMNVLDDVIKMLLSFAKDNGDRVGSLVVFEFFPNKKIREVGNEETAFAARGDYYHASTAFRWDDENLDKEVRGFNRELVKILRERCALREVGQYCNYDGDYIDPKSAFGNNIHRLRELKKKYDPTNVFCKRNGVWPRSEQEQHCPSGPVAGNKTGSLQPTCHAALVER